MKALKILLFSLCIWNVFPTFSQHDKIWSIGLGINIVDNTGGLSQLFDVRKGWNCLPFPSTLIVGYKYNDYFRFEFMEALNSFNRSKYVNSFKINAPQKFYSTCFKTNLNLNVFYNSTAKFEPFLTAGFSITSIDRVVLLQPVIGAGGNYWLDKSVAISAQALTYWGVTQSANNFFMYTLGFKTVFGDKREKKEEKENQINNR